MAKTVITLRKTIVHDHCAASWAENHKTGIKLHCSFLWEGRFKSWGKQFGISSSFSFLKKASNVLVTGLSDTSDLTFFVDRTDWRDAWGLFASPSRNSRRTKKFSDLEGVNWETYRSRNQSATTRFLAREYPLILLADKAGAGRAGSGEAGPAPQCAGKIAQNKFSETSLVNLIGAEQAPCPQTIRTMSGGISSSTACVIFSSPHIRHTRFRGHYHLISVQVWQTEVWRRFEGAWLADGTPDCTKLLHANYHVSLSAT